MLDLTEDMIEAEDEGDAVEGSAEDAEMMSAGEAEVAMVEPRQPDVVFGETTHAAAPRAPQKPAAAPRAAEAPRMEHMHADEGQPSAGARQLLSPTSDATVAAAFGKLANTILTHDARTLDDIVKEMLRPMLKEWLDDNLPPLVERLVRDEIERVSRGRP